ncbi:hypothetical protein HK096_009965 [Nowakowskiella sp. JEL0078]|nr:hypothetical protein HK096_009965 [Nowakowskiella sp. JEL0078]
MKNIISTVLEHESHLFLPEELSLFTNFSILRAESKLLFIRLLNRRHKLVRFSQIKWTNVESTIEEACSGLCDGNIFAKCNGPNSLLEWLNILTRKELLGWAKMRRLSNFSKKKVDELRDDLIRNIKSQPTFSFNPILSVNHACEEFLFKVKNSVVESK